LAALPAFHGLAWLGQPKLSVDKLHNVFAYIFSFQIPVGGQERQAQRIEDRLNLRACSYPVVNGNRVWEGQLAISFDRLGDVLPLFLASNHPTRRAGFLTNLCFSHTPEDAA